MMLQTNLMCYRLAPPLLLGKYAADECMEMPTLIV